MRNKNILLSFFRYFPNQYIGIIAIAGMMAGLVISKVVLSVATITLMCNAIVNSRIKENMIKWSKDKTSIILVSLFIVYLLSGLYSANNAYWVDRCRMKLPYLALPIGFMALKPFTKKTFQTLLYFYFYVMLVSGICIFIKYINHYAEYNSIIQHGGPLPTPQADHIRFSLEIAFAIIVGIYLFFDSFYIWRKSEKILLAAGIIFLFIFIHVLAVRSGLLSLYAALLFALIRWIISNKKYIPGLLLFAGTALIVFAAFKFIPSLKDKVGYFNYEWNLIQQGQMKEAHNDAQRILSIEYGLDIAKKNIWLGVGAGDIKDEMDIAYKQSKDYDSNRTKLPHNQFVFVFAATGAIGLSVFLLGLALPVFTRNRKRSFLFIAFNIIIFLSLFSEHTLEIQIGTAFYLLFLLLISHYLDYEKETGIYNEA